jgi:dihydrofolate synthase/folylpolyglutamate synthase
MKPSGPSLGARERLDGRIGRGWRLGLDGMRKALDRMGHPEFPVILVGGTNGKGSVSAMIHQALLDDGMSVGLTTSPHLRDVRERIVVNGEIASEREFETLYEDVEAVDEWDSTYFETLALMAVLHFRRRRVDAAVVEVGLGGRLDAFNALDPVVSVVTSVALDHEEHLGETLEKIAIEKAQIARRGRPCVLGTELPALRDEVERIGGRVLLAPRPKDALYRELNIEIAVEAVRAFCGETGRSIDEERCRVSCEKTYWPGRFEVFAGAPPVILDAAHNPAAADELARAMRRFSAGRHVVAVVAFLRDKDAPGFFVRLDDVVDEWFVTEVDAARARPAAEAPAPYNAIVVADPVEALERARAAAGPGGVVLVTGSIYLLGELLAKTELGE